MALDTARLNSLWAHHTIEELWRLGVDYFCISPGSRSTPLTVAAARHPRVKTVICHDERGAAFHLLGYARGSGKVGAMITTSGTAIAHALPAVIEAKINALPFLLISADRPAEARGTGANQTIDQVKLFGAHTAFFMDMPCPDENVGLPWLFSTLAQALQRSKGPGGGPVHLNFQFRKPLDPVDIQDLLVDPILGRDATHPHTQFMPVAQGLSEAGVHHLWARLSQAKRGMIIAGDMAQSTDAQGVLALAKALGWPLYADITSDLRLGGGYERAIPHWDQLLLNPKLAKALEPDLVLAFGGPLVSKRMNEWLGNSEALQRVHIDHRHQHQDAHLGGGLFIEGQIQPICAQLIQHLELAHGAGEAAIGAIQAAGDWYSGVQGIHDRIGALLSQWQGLNALDEIQISQILARELGPEDALFISNSMPIRDLDDFAGSKGSGAVIGSNRGASGIDGMVACAAGYAAGTAKRTLLLVGDLAALYDLSSWAILAQEEPDLWVVLIQNNGGGIFEFLPIRGKAEDVFETHFATPTHVDFSHIAQAFDLDFQRIESAEALSGALQARRGQKGPKVLEIPIERDVNREAHRHLKAQVEGALQKMIEDGDGPWP